MSFDIAVGAKFIRSQQTGEKMCQNIIHVDELIVF